MAREVRFRFDDIINKANNNFSRLPEQPFYLSETRNTYTEYSQHNNRPSTMQDYANSNSNNNLPSSARRTLPVPQPPHQHSKLVPGVNSLVTILSHILKQRKNTCFKAIKSVSNSSQQLLHKFMGHCATLIQKHYRRYIARKHYRKIRLIVARMKELFNAASEGWKTRRVLALRSNQRVIEEIKGKLAQGKLKDARILRRDLGRELQKQLKSDRWLEEYRITKKQQAKAIKTQNLLTTLKSTKALETNPSNTTENNQLLVNKVVPAVARSAPRVQQSFDQRPIRKTESADHPVSFDQMPIRTTKTLQRYDQEDGFGSNAFQSEDRAFQAKSKPKPKAQKKKVVLKNPNAQSQANTAVQKPAAIVQSQPNKPELVNLPSSQQPIDQSQDIRKAYLKRRVKYDPRKAIQQQKRRKSQMKSVPKHQDQSAGVAARVVPIRTIQVQQPFNSHHGLDGATNIINNPSSRSTSTTRQKKIQPDMQQLEQVRLNPLTTPKPANIPLSTPKTHTIIGSSSSSHFYKNTPSTQSQPISSSNLQVSIKPAPTAGSHFGIQELESTMNGAYSRKKTQMIMEIESLNRVSRKLNYPITTVRCGSKIYKEYRLNQSHIKEAMLETCFFDLLKR